jgi:hypothetical protein
MLPETSGRWDSLHPKAAAYAKALVAQYPSCYALIIYGSVGRQESNANSDLDALVVTSCDWNGDFVVPPDCKWDLYLRNKRGVTMIGTIDAILKSIEGNVECYAKFCDAFYFECVGTNHQPTFFVETVYSRYLQDKHISDQMRGTTSADVSSWIVEERLPEIPPEKRIKMLGYHPIAMLTRDIYFSCFTKSTELDWSNYLWKTEERAEMLSTMSNSPPSTALMSVTFMEASKLFRIILDIREANETDAYARISGRVLFTVRTLVGVLDVCCQS